MFLKTKLKVEGTRCESCKTLIETEVEALEGVKKVSLDFDSGLCQIEYDDQKITLDLIKKVIRKLGYQVKPLERKTGEKKNRKNLLFLIIAIIFFAIAYFVIQKLGLLEILAKLNEQKLSYPLIFFIGILASFHCIGMCGGLIVTYSAASKQKEKKNRLGFSKPHFQYNLGRIISYTAIGAVLGGIGSFFGINPIFTGIITLLAAVFMILMGLSLLTNFAWLEKIKLRTPGFIAKFLYKNKHSQKPKGPFLIGLLNGFMPCGPLQAMQLYALASGSPFKGALSMGIYALGTVPLLFGFGSVISFFKSAYLKKVMKFSGAVVIILGLFMASRGLTNFGVGFQGMIPKKQTSEKEYLVTGNVDEYQVVNMDLSYSGYSPNVLYVKKGIPVRWVINAKQISGCTDEIVMPDYDIRKKIEKGENIIEFTPKEEGEIKFSCGMRMVWGKFIVTKREVKSGDENLYQKKIDSTQSGSCHGVGENDQGVDQSSCGCGSRIGVE